MKKINALFFAMALVAIVAFASTAGAATKLLGVDKDGYIKLLTIDKDAENKFKTDEFGTQSDGLFPAVLGANARLFSYGDQKIAAITSDDEQTVYLFDVSDGVKVDKKIKNTGLGANTVAPVQENVEAIKAVLTFNGDPVFITGEKIGTVDTDDEINMVSASADVAFVYGSKFYIIAMVSEDTTSKKYVGIQSAPTGTVSTPSTVASGEVVRELVDITQGAVEKYDTDKAAVVTGNSSTLLSADGSLLPSVVLGNTLYIASSDTLLKASLGSPSSTLKLSNGLALKNLDSSENRAQGSYAALFKKDEKTVYAVKQNSNHELFPVILAVGDNGLLDVKQSLAVDISKDFSGEDASIDVFGNDEVFIVVAHARGIAAYDAETLKLIHGGQDIRSAAMFSTSAGGGTTSQDQTVSDDTPAKPNDYLTAANLSATEAAALLANANISSADLVSADVENATTFPDAAQEKIEALLKPGENEKVTVTAVKKVTPKEAGAVLVKAAIPASSKAYFVEESVTTTSLAADGDPTEATLLNANFAKATSGNSVYAAAKDLEAGKAYTLVEAKVEDNGGGGTSGSGGGCEVGLGLWALAALALVSKKLSERR